jgi:hypothetical protein
MAYEARDSSSSSVQKNPRQPAALMTNVALMTKKITIPVDKKIQMAKSLLTSETGFRK